MTVICLLFSIPLLSRGRSIAGRGCNPRPTREFVRLRMFSEVIGGDLACEPVLVRRLTHFHSELWESASGLEAQRRFRRDAFPSGAWVRRGRPACGPLESHPEIVAGFRVFDIPLGSFCNSGVGGGRNENSGMTMMRRNVAWERQGKRVEMGGGGDRSGRGCNPRPAREFALEDDAEVAAGI